MPGRSLALPAVLLALVGPGGALADGGAGLPTAHKHRRQRGHWLTVSVTQYWPAPEAWFVGRAVAAPGLSGRHRIDWLYSAQGVCMQGEGIGLDGRMYHLEAAGRGGWVTATGSPTSAARGFRGGAPFWRAGGFWRTRGGAVTFPLQAGGWYAGPGRRYVPLMGVRFAPGPSKPLRYWRSIAVDPRVIPLGSRVYIPAYRHDGYGGWFVAQDTGGAIVGRRIDVYRPPPALAGDPGLSLPAARVLVVFPHG